MNENIKKFFEKAAEDPELQKKFAYLSDPEEAYKFAAGVQEGFTRDEFIAAMKSLYENVIQDVSEDDMAKIAGGCFDPRGCCTMSNRPFSLNFPNIDWSKVRPIA